MMAVAQHKSMALHGRFRVSHGADGWSLFDSRTDLPTDLFISAGIL